MSMKFSSKPLRNIVFASPSSGVNFLGEKAGWTWGVLASLLSLGISVGAQEVPQIYQGADMKVGEKLISENQCDACHVRNVGGNGHGIYRPNGRVNSPALLRGQVEACNTTLNLALFPDEVNSIAAVLNRDHYKFK